MLIHPTMKQLLARALRRAYPAGPDSGKDALVASRLMVEDVTNEISAILQITGKPVELDVEGYRRPNELKVVTGLIVYLADADGDGGKTVIIPARVTLNTCHIAGKPVWLMQPNAASELIDVILDAVEDVIESNKVDTMVDRLVPRFAQELLDREFGE